MSESLSVNFNSISRDLKIPAEVLESVTRLLDRGDPPAFIARYEREAAGSLSEEKIRRTEAAVKEQRKLNQRKDVMLRTLESAGKLTPDLEHKIREARNDRRLDDLFLPFKTGKEDSAALKDARLAALAADILDGTHADLDLSARTVELINPAKGWNTEEDVLAALIELIAKKECENIELRQKIREWIRMSGRFVTKMCPVPAKKKRKDSKPSVVPVAVQAVSPETEVPAVAAEPISEVETSTEPVANAETNLDVVAESTEDTTNNEPNTEASTVEVAEQTADVSDIETAPVDTPVEKTEDAVPARFKQFEAYFNLNVDLRTCPGHMLLEMVRAQRAGAIDLQIALDDSGLEAARAVALLPDHPQAGFLEKCINCAIKELLLPALKKEVRQELVHQAQEQLSRSLAKNLRNLMLREPLIRRRVLAIAPGLNRSCKLAALDEFGNFLAAETVYLTGNTDRKSRNLKKVARLVDRFNLSAIAIGNGVGSRDAEDFVARLLSEQFADKDVAYIVINEVGAASYSISPLAKQELPDCNALVRVAISLGRRLQDPVTEMAKIEPVNLVVGLTPQEAKPRNLKETLQEIVALAVNRRGLDVNLAEETALRYISGLTGVMARRIVEYRQEHGPFRRREDLKNVPGMTETLWRYAIGFLRIPNGYEPLDATWIHPEQYEMARALLAKFGFVDTDLRDPVKVETIAAIRREVMFRDLAEEFSTDIATIKMMLGEFIEPGRDTFRDLSPLLFKKGTMKFEDLTPGMELVGTVVNVVDFGAFVDIGLHHSGLVHISQMGDGYVKNSQDKFSVGQVVKVWVLNVDMTNHRISLTMLPPNRGEQSRAPRSRDKERTERPPQDNAPRTRNDERGSDTTRTNDSDRTSNRSNDRRGDRPQQDRRDDRRGDGKSDRSSNAGYKRNDNSDSRSRSDRDRDRDGKRRFDKGEKSPRVIVAEAKPKKIVPLSDNVKKGKEPMRSFSDLAQLFGRVAPDEDAKKK